MKSTHLTGIQPVAVVVRRTDPVGNKYKPRGILVPGALHEKRPRMHSHAIMGAESRQVPTPKDIHRVGLATYTGVC